MRMEQEGMSEWKGGSWNGKVEVGESSEKCEMEDWEIV